MKPRSDSIGTEMALEYDRTAEHGSAPLMLQGERAGSRPSCGPMRPAIGNCRHRPDARPVARRGKRHNADRTALHQGWSVSLCGDRIPIDHQRDPQPRRLRGVPSRRCRGARILVPGRLRRAGAEVFPESRRRRAPEADRGGNRSLMAVALGTGPRGARRPARGRAVRRRAFLQAGVRPSGRLLDLLGLEGRLLHQRGRRPRLP